MCDPLLSGNNGIFSVLHIKTKFICLEPRLDFV